MGARLIQASAHVRRGGGDAVKLLPSAVDLGYTQVGGDFSPGGGGFARDRTKPAEFWHHSQLSSFSSLCILPFIVPQVATNLGPVTDLIVVRARRECGKCPFAGKLILRARGTTMKWSRQRIS